jgi:hypothetical protein
VHLADGTDFSQKLAASIFRVAANLKTHSLTPLNLYAFPVYMSYWSCLWHFTMSAGLSVSVYNKFVGNNVKISHRCQICSFRLSNTSYKMCRYAYDTTVQQIAHFSIYCCLVNVNKLKTKENLKFYTLQKSERKATQTSYILQIPVTINHTGNLS